MPSSSATGSQDGVSDLQKLQQLLNTLSVSLGDDPQKSTLVTELKEVVGNLKLNSNEGSSKPCLDLRTKKHEIEPLLAELKAPTSSSSLLPKRELLDEVIASLTTWLEEIWQTVYERKIEFEEAHRCLLYAWETLTEIKTVDSDLVEGGGRSNRCRCAIMGYPLRFTIRNSRGKLIRTFDSKFVCIRTADRVMIWLWRELLVSLASLATSESDKARVKSQISCMIMDLEEIMGGPRVLERLLHGGLTDLKCLIGGRHEDEEGEWEDESDNLDLEDDLDGHANEDDSETEDNDGEDEGLEDTDNPHSHCACSLHAPHWPKTLTYHSRLFLSEVVEQRLMCTFAVSPSMDCYRSILSITPSGHQEHKAKELLELLWTIACSSSSSFASALEIYSVHGETDRLAQLLESHSHLLRPCDTPTYQLATRSLVSFPTSILPFSFSTPSLKGKEKAVKDPNYKQQLALKIVETQLRDLVHSVKLGIHACFDKIQDPQRLTELKNILALRSNSNRKERVETWVESVETATSSDLFDPMIFAAFVMGFGAPFGNLGTDEEEEEGNIVDALNQMSGHGEDEDYLLLKEQYSPPWKDHFEGWLAIAGLPALKKVPMPAVGGERPAAMSGQMMLMKIYVKMVEEMPWLKGKDVVAEMAAHLTDRPAKAHVQGALEALGAFAKLQRSNMQLKADKKKRKQQEAKASGGTSATAQPASAPSSSPTTAAPAAPVIPINARSEHQFSFNNPPPVPSNRPRAANPAPIPTLGGLDDVD